MKIIVTGSLGHISKPLTIALLQNGHSVTVISSNPERKAAIETLGAEAAIGSVGDTGFLATVFKGADAAYCMIPGSESFFDPAFDVYAYTVQVARNFKEAIQQADIRKVIHLSSIGAHTDQNNGLLRFHFMAENVFRELPNDVVIKTMRPVGFYYNMLAFIPTIQSQGAIISNYNAAYQEPWVSPSDIAEAVAEEFDSAFDGRKIRYIASDELTGDEVAAILGNAIGRPALPWAKISDEQMLNGMLGIGMNAQVAKGLVEMNAARQSGELFEDYNRHRPVLGKTKLASFAQNEFALAYNRK